MQPDRCRDERRDRRTGEGLEQPEAELDDAVVAGREGIPDEARPPR